MSSWATKWGKSYSVWKLRQGPRRASSWPYAKSFDTLMKPILSGVWSPSFGAILIVSLQYTRCILRVKARTSKIITAVKCGRLPASTACYISALYFMNWLHHTSDDKLQSECIVNWKIITFNGLQHGQQMHWSWQIYQLSRLNIQRCITYTYVHVCGYLFSTVVCYGYVCLVCVYMQVCVLMRIPSCIDLLPCHLFVSHVFFFLYVYLLNKWFLISQTTFFINLVYKSAWLAFESHFKNAYNDYILLFNGTISTISEVALQFAYVRDRKKDTSPKILVCRNKGPICK